MEELARPTGVMMLRDMSPGPDILSPEEVRFPGTMSGFYDGIIRTRRRDVSGNIPVYFTPPNDH